MTFSGESLISEAYLASMRYDLLLRFACEARPYGATAGDVISDYLQGKPVRPEFLREIHRHVGSLGVPRAVVLAELEKLAAAQGAATTVDLSILTHTYGPDPSVRQANEILTYAKRLVKTTRSLERRKQEALELARAVEAVPSERFAEQQSQEVAP